MVTGRALSHLSVSVLPPGAATGMHLLHRQAVVFVSQDIPLLDSQTLKHSFPFSFSTFMLYPSPIPFLSSD